ncbi:hypothetical protein [Arthrobacter sp. zg-Y769]|uniref:hypothetical protein n=1 Tax=Arthrobacter sp. zg-Y769 TaxID=2894191 RepID=UPI001E54F562|nr:hypothetical protein [Arthrobacter sp. zg-Y769]MCC9206150.1 hypothetical protein [Arthrobacter sp. zg-Y769]
MNKSIKASALLVAGVFALSGCGSSEGDSGSASDETKSASASPTAELTVGKDQYTAAELEEVLAAVKTGQEASGEVIPDAVLRPELGGAGSPDGVTITPEKCVEILGFANFFGDIEEANVAALELSETEKLTVVSHAEASTLDKQVEETGSVLDDCADFEMKGEEEGEVATGTTERQEVSTDAPSTEGFVLTLAAAGEELSGLKVAAASGTTNISVTVSDATDLPAAVAKAEETINAVYAELEKK